MSPARVLAYVRVSGQEQGRSGTSLDGQSSLVRSFCAMREWPEPTLYVEIESAGAEKIERRSELRRLLKDVVAGDAILVCAVDRWSRDIVFAVQSVRELVARKIGWFSIIDNLDAATPQGDSTLGIMAWVADQERQRIRTRTVGRKRELRAEGKYVEGRIPFGYRRISRSLEVVESEAAIVREGFRMCIVGWTLREIGEELTRTTGSRWELWRVHKMLTNRIYLGEISTADGSSTTQRTHAAIVDAATFDRAQAAMLRRRTSDRKHNDPRARTRNWLMAGVATCASCGARMGAAYGNNGLDYYACAARRRGDGCSAAYTRVDAADSSVAMQVEERLADLRHMLARSGSDTRAAAPMKTSIEKRRKALEDQFHRATQLAIEGLIDAARLRTQKERIERDLAVLQAEEQERERAVKRTSPKALRAVLDRVRVLRDAWAAMTTEERRRVLCLLAHEVQLNAGAAPAIVWRTTEELAEDAEGRNG